MAWMILGSTLIVRSDQSSRGLSGDVYSLWGPPAVQSPPRGSYAVDRVRSETTTVVGADGVPRQQVTETVETVHEPVPLVGSEIAVDLSLEHRKRGLMWFPTYTVTFEADYRFENPSPEAHRVEVVFPLASEQAGYDDFLVLGPDGAPLPFEIRHSAAHFGHEVLPGEEISFRVEYRTRGTESFQYAMVGDDTRVRDFRLRMRTDFEAIDFPAGSLSPSTHERSGDGWVGTWEFRSLISNAPVGVLLPQRLNPGPLASKITFFAPVCLLFFFFVVALVAASRGVDLHPMHYFFLGCAFFAFDLLFAYLVDHVSVGVSFALSAVTSVFLVVTYARLFTGWRFALRVMGVAQLIYLVLFSYSFFWEGFTGLAVTVGAIATLFVMMQLTGRIDWNTWRRGGPEDPPELSDGGADALLGPASVAARPTAF